MNVLVSTAAFLEIPMPGVAKQPEHTCNMLQMHLIYHCPQRWKCPRRSTPPVRSLRIPNSKQTTLRSISMESGPAGRARATIPLVF